MNGRPPPRRRLDRHIGGRPASGTTVARVLAGLANLQHGVVARRQLLGEGLSRDVIDKLVMRGTLHVVHRGVYAVGHTVLSQRGRWMAAVLACGDDAALSHVPAGHLLGLRSTQARIVDVTTPRAGGRERRGVRAHRAILVRHEVMVVDGIPVTSVPRTLVDLAGVLTPRQLRRAVHQADAMGGLRLDELDAAARGRPGAAALRRILDELDPSRLELTASGLEAAFLEIVARHGIAAPEVNQPLGDYRADFLWRAERLIVETDGRDVHTRRAAFESDRRRDEDLARLGFQVLRFTAFRLRAHAEVAESVSTCLRLRRMAG